MAQSSYKLMIVAGEPSGDLHAAKLVNAFREVSPGAAFEFFGSAGERMREAGVEAIVKADGLSMVGLAEIAGALPMFLRTFNILKKTAIERKPDAAILVDFPDFNLKLAKSLHKQGCRIIYYISPQLWAWRQYRIATIRHYVDLVISILPFEKAWYEERGVANVEYVGSPLAREVETTQDKTNFCARHHLAPDKPVVSLLPGSRHKEIVRILPVMLDAAKNMLRSNPDIQFLVPIMSEKNSIDARAAIEKGSSLNEKITLIKGETFNALHASDAAAVASGTATLETGIIGTPMAIVYKTSVLNYK